MSEGGQNTDDRFSQQLTENQSRIYAYIHSLLGNPNHAHDVLQETNLVLWKKSSQYDPAKPFIAWAFGIARFQVLACIRDRQRDRLLLDAELAEKLSPAIEAEIGNLDDYREALHECLAALTPASREMIHQRYHQNQSIAEIAESSERSVGAIKVALLRTRQKLFRCVSDRVETEQR